MRTSLFWLSTAITLVPTFAQTSSKCNPLKESCPADPALSNAVFYDFTQGLPDDFTVSTGAAPTFDGKGAHFSIAQHGDSPTMSSTWYMMFGHYDVVMQTAPGVGVVSSLVLLSDDLDEVDWEWLGADDTNVQSNYFGKGDTSVYDRGMNLTAPGAQDGFHTYSLDWTSAAIVWSIDGTPMRTLTPDTADVNQYPQTPMQLKIGSWAAGDSSEPQGTIDWAGGSINYDDGPFVMTVKSVRAVDYSTGKSYSYGDQSGNWQSIDSDGGKILASDNPSASVSTAATAASTSKSSIGVSSTVPVSTATSASASSASAATTMSSSQSTTANPSSSTSSPSASASVSSDSGSSSSTTRPLSISGSILGLFLGVALLLL